MVLIISTLKTTWCKRYEAFGSFFLGTCSPISLISSFVVSHGHETELQPMSCEDCMPLTGLTHELSHIAIIALAPCTSLRQQTLQPWKSPALAKMAKPQDRRGQGPESHTTSNHSPKAPFRIWECG